MENKRDTRILHSLENALLMLELFKENEELGVSRIAREMGIAKSTAFRMLNTLEKYNYIQRDPGTSRYRLGMKLAFWGQIVRDRNEIIHVAHPHLVFITNEVREVSFLAVLEDDYRVRYIDRVVYNAINSLCVSHVGGTMPAYATACGKVLLANLRQEHLREYLDTVELAGMTPNTITDRETLCKELNKIREEELSVDNEESEHGLTCFAVPIKDPLGVTVASVSISGATGKITLEKEEKIRLLKETARKIMLEL